MSDQVASHSDETQEQVQAAFEVFDLVEDDTPTDEQETKDTQDAATDDPPATEEETEPNVIKVKAKVDKEEREFEIPEDQLPEYVQKAYALDRERERKSELQKNLERAAKLAGFEKVDDYLSNLDRLEQEAKQREENQFQELRQQLRQEAEEAGLDPERVESYLENHPLMKQARQALKEREETTRQIQEMQQAAEWQSKWKVLYDAYPDLQETADAFLEGKEPDWYTPEMKARIERGYDPIDAYELAHKEALMEKNRHLERQRAIRDQRLGKRAQVETETVTDQDPEVPQELASAFSLFGLDPRSAKKYVKK